MKILTFGLALSEEIGCVGAEYSLEAVLRLLIGVEFGLVIYLVRSLVSSDLCLALLGLGPD